VPVLELGAEVVVDSTAILEWLERRFPEPPLYPRDPARRTEVRLLIDWFDRVWKRPPNELVALRAAPVRDERRIAELSAALAASLDAFEALLTGRAYLIGERFSAADCAVFPFLKYPVLGLAPGDEDPFHRVLVDGMPLGSGYPRVRDWVARVDRRPRA
jgi:glutathione S-transferase